MTSRQEMRKHRSLEEQALHAAAGSTTVDDAKIWWRKRREQWVELKSTGFVSTEHKVKEFERVKTWETALALNNVTQALRCNGFWAG